MNKSPRIDALRENQPVMMNLSESVELNPSKLTTLLERMFDMNFKLGLRTSAGVVDLTADDRNAVNKP